MSAGELRHRATLRRFENTESALGGDVQVPVVAASRVPVRVFEQGSREVWQAQQVKATITHLVKLRWMPGIDTTMEWIWHDGTTDRTLAIKAPPTNPDGKRQYLHVMCTEGG